MQKRTQKALGNKPITNAALWLKELKKARLMTTLSLLR